MKNLWIVLLCLGQLFFTSLQAQDIQKLKAKYRKAIIEKMQKTNVAGASVVFVHGKQTIWSEGFGLADKKNQVKATTDTKFMLGSVTKVFTATGLMQLHERGQLNIYQPVKKALPTFNIRSRFGKTDQVTLKNVLTHHAGLPSDILRGGLGTKVEHFTEAINYLNQNSLALPPNLIQAYSNVGYALLGCVIEKVSGKKYASYLKSNIFTPLQMNNSGIFNGGQYPANFTKYYNGKGKESSEVAIRDVPAGAMYATAHDLGNFLKAMFLTNTSQQVLKKKTLKEIFKVQNPNCPLDLGAKQGLCWFIQEDAQLGQVFKHSGDTKYAHALIAVIPELSLGVAFLTNSSNGTRIRGMAIDLMKEYAKLKNLKTSQVVSKPKVAFKKYQLVQKNPQELKKYTGTYAHPGIGVFEMKLVKDTLQANLGGQFGQFLPTQKGYFVVKIPGPGIIPSIRMGFDKVKGYQVMIQIQQNGSKELLGHKVVLKPIASHWKKRAGKYKIINKLPGETLILSDFELVFKKNYLTVKAVENIGNSAVTMAVQPNNANEGYTLGIGRHGGTYLHFTKNAQGQEILNFHGYQMVRED